MDRRRNEVLGILGIEQWQLRDRGAGAPAPQAAAEAAPSMVAAPTVGVPAPADADGSKAPTMPPTGLVDHEIAADWPGLKKQVAGCTRCKLCKTRTQTVFGIGHPQADLMIVGEGPGADEDATGEPFVGRAGKLLDEMLKAIGRNRAVGAEETPVNAASLASAATAPVFIVNVVKCRPPGNRDPEKDEVEACRHYLDAQIAHVKPKLIVALGRIAAQRLLLTDEPLSRLRGPVHRYGADNTPVMVTYHPAYLLRSPKEKAKSWEDLKKIAQHLKANG